MRKLFLIALLFFSSSLFASIGHIMALRGDVSVVRATTSIAATMGMALQQKDTIITKKSSRVQVMLEDKTVITIGSNSNFKFEEYSFDGTANSKVSLKATKGFFRSVTGKIGKIAPKRFKLKTRSATIGIRGTDFWGDIAPQKEVIACISGAISIELDRGGNFDIDAGSLIVVEPKKAQVQKIEIVEKKKVEKKESVKKEESKDENEDSQTDSSSQEQIQQPVIQEVQQLTIEPEPIEDIADVTQQADEEVEHYNYPPQPEPQVNPLTLTPSTQDREKRY